MTWSSEIDLKIKVVHFGLVKSSLCFKIVETTQKCSNRVLIGIIWIKPIVSALKRPLQVNQLELGIYVRKKSCVSSSN